MDVVRHLLLAVHLLGIAALLTGLLVQTPRPEKSVTVLIRAGAGTAFVAGLLLVGLFEADDGSADYAKVTVGTVVGLVVLVLVMANLRKRRIATGLWALLLVLSVAYAGVAVFWSPTHT